MKNTMKTDPLLLDLDERNLAQFLAAIALAGFTERIDGPERDARSCWWRDDGCFAILTEFQPEDLRQRLFTKAHSFLKALKWISGLGGAAHGALVTDGEIGINPFVTLTGDPKETTPLKGFSARVVPKDLLPQQRDALKAPSQCPDWLAQVERGVSSWGFDWRTSAHASDAGISSDAEGTGYRDPIFTAIELLSLTAASFFVAAHGWQVNGEKLRVASWVQAIPHPVVPLASAGRIVGLPKRSYQFAYRGASHGKGAAYHFFPEAIPDTTPAYV